MSVWCWVACIWVLQILRQINGFDLVRLTNKGADNRSYTVELHYDQKWRTICGHHWSAANARVVCRQSGQPSTRCVAEFRLSKDLEEEEAEALNLNYQCVGNETALHRCPYDFSSTISQEPCRTQPRFAVICGTQCPAWRYGEDCRQCPCNQNNTATCDDKTGKCTCKAGFSGDTCDCQDGKHTCNPTTSFCHMENGNPVCLCKKGAKSTSNNKCNGFGLRFVDRAANESGEVEFYTNGTWNSLCIMRSSNTEMFDVICRQLGRPTVHASAFLSKYIPKTDLPDYEIAEAICVGSETSLADCKMTMVSAMSCNIAVGILCSSECPKWRFGENCNFCSCNKTNTESCDPSTGECKCKSGFTGATCDCLQGNNPCNETISECHAQTGTPTCLCKTEFIRKNYSCTDPVRLANLSTSVTTSGSVIYEGRVELYVNGSWGTLCDDAAHPGVKMLEVLCRSLGLPSTYSDYAGAAYYGSGVGPIHYSFLHCTGKEQSVKQCYTSRASYCSHSEDLGIICSDECPDYKFGRKCLNCQCVQSNTQFCNKTSGECVCKDGYEGQTCSCEKGKHKCDLQTSICEDNMCYCKFENNNTKSSCFERLRLDKDNGSSLQYHANNQWNYLCNDIASSKFASEQILCRVLGQPTKITKLEGKFNFQKGYKFTVDGNCQNPFLPTGAECLIFENTTTTCHNGILTLQCLKECPDGMYFRQTGYGCVDCPCNMTNTERCDKTGKCICKAGYEGALCNCVKNICNTAVAFCQNTQNGTSCLCKPGYENRGYNCEDSMRLEVSNQSYSKLVVYKIDSSWVYASTPSSYVDPSERGLICERMGLPTFYNEFGVENLPQPMAVTDFECAFKEYIALSLNYSECSIQYRHRYFSPYSSRIRTASCLEDCPRMMFFNVTSAECVLCGCNDNNTISCNQTTGECNCKAGFFGPSCDCIQNQHNCNNTYSYCSLDGSTPTCTCRVGFYGKNLNCFEPLRFIKGTDVLELYDRGEWKLIASSYQWDDDESNVICRQLGLPTFYVAYTTKYRSATSLTYSDYNNKKKVTYLSCSGEEKEVSQCSFSTSTYISSYTSFAIVECRKDCPDFLYGPTCKRCECNQQYTRYCNKTTGECICNSGYYGDTCDCVQGTHFCNATFAFCGLPTPSCYCRDQYNRRGLGCQDSLRFYNNANGSKGVLQIYRNQSWNTFCDDSFSREEALVACRQMRLPTRYVTFATRKYSQRIPGEYNLGIVYTIQCTGKETSLSECERFSTHGSYCSHSEDVYLQCFSECPKWTYGDECENQCVCNQTNSLSCDEDTGKCSCKPGYFGDFCNCKTGVHKCDATISVCHTNSSGDGVCLCKAGLSDRDYQKEGCYKEYVRLINQTSSNEAVVEIFHLGKWGGICKSGWTKKDAQVVCQQFGLPSDNAQISRRFTVMPSSYFSWTDVACNGTEKSLLGCVKVYSSSAYCYGRKAAVIACPNEPWIRLIQLPTTGTKTSGTLQVLHNNQWGYVCRSGFDDNDARVACRELGLPTKYAKSESGSISGRRSVTHLKYVRCNGEEESLADCSADNGSYCYSYSNSRVQISCDSVCPRLKYGENCQLNCPCHYLNAASCDIETGQCVCKPGYSGFSCGCTAGSHGCNTTVSDCHTESGKTFCICKKGFTNAEHGCIDNVRLSNENIVQVFAVDGWKYACRNSFWERKNALVFCRQLNQSTDFIYSASKYRSYSSQTSKRRIACNGTEELLTDCSSTLQTSTCYYNAKLLCGKCPDWTYSSDCSNSCVCNRDHSLGCDLDNGSCICQKNFKGDDCSCHAAVDSCPGKHSKCKFDRCVCEEGSFNQTASCSDLKDIIYFCSFQTYSWRDICSIKTENYRGNRHSYASWSSWRPKSGSDNFNYLYVDTRPYYISAQSYFNEMNLTLHIQRKQFCLYFDYVIRGRGSITVWTIDEMYSESTVASLSDFTPKNWTTKYIQINGTHAITQIKIRMEEKTAIDRIIAAGTSCVCPAWTFGRECDKCACVRLHTQSCDKTSGTCQCKAGYTGDACQCEDNGKPCLHDIRLVNGNTTNMGRVEVVTDGIWSTVCDGNWDDNDATVVCKHLGIAKYGIPVLNAGFGKGMGPVHVARVECQGNETDFMECPFIRSSCDHSNDAGVICVNASSIIRLRGGSDQTQGRLEIKLQEGGKWGTVCDDGFSKVDARVACRQLELPTRNAQYKTSAYYGQGTGKILLSNLQCNGDETAIQQCRATKNPSSYSCGHYEDVGISCTNDCPSYKYGEQCENDCVCDQSNSVSCDKDSGECNCNSGWTGSRCTCRGNMKCDENTYCDGSKCLCMDGFFTKPSNCSDDAAVMYSCSFETDFETCSIVNYGEMKWRKDSSGTPSDDTGPYSAKRGKYYVYTEATSKSTGDTGVMEIPLNKLKSRKNNCFQFYFHMRGDDMGDLNITTEDQMGSEIARWTKSGHYGSRWDRGYLSLSADTHKIKITGIRGSGYQSDIALDDFKILQGHCECDQWKYGLTCEKSCNCRRSSSEGCDSQTGSCACRSGWSGKTCNCRKATDTCHVAYSYCHGNQCLCKDGEYNTGVTCSGMNDITYFCSFDSPDSVGQCKMELFPFKWDIEESPRHSITDKYHLDNNRYLITRISSLGNMYTFTIRNITIKSTSCLQVKYFTRDPKKQMLRIQVIKDKNHLMSNKLFQGRDWSTARVSLAAASNVKIHFMAFIYNSLPVLIDDIIITAKDCGSCSQWYYGSDCEKMSKCNRTNTLSFDTKDQCSCKSNWYGERCDCSKAQNDACKMKPGEVCMGGTCTCKDGYTKAGLGCRDIDECKILCKGPLQMCTNTDGSYKCVCKPGTFGDGNICSESVFAVTNGSHPREGTLLMWQNNAWGTVCQPFDLRSAMKACKSIFPEIFGVHLAKKGYKSPNGISYSSVSCDYKTKESGQTKCDASIEPCDTEKNAMFGTCGVCGRKYTKQFGLVEPEPLQIPANTLCYFLLSPFNAKSINATIIALSMNPNNETRSKRSIASCDDTYLEIYDGPDMNSPSLGRYCRSRPRFSINSKGNSLFVVYKTARDTSKHDFQMIYETEKSVEDPHALGESCVHSTQCVANNASCVNNRCSCLRDYYMFDTVTCSEKKHWNSSCLRHEECKTGYCDPENSLCSCQSFSEIDVENDKCVAKAASQEQTENSAVWLVPLLFFIFLVIIILIAAIVVFARRKGYTLWRRGNDATFTYSELMSASNPLYGYNADDKSSHRGSVISISLSGDDGSHRIRLSSFGEIYESMCDNVNWPEEEFQNIIQISQQRPSDIGAASQNRHKNRHRDVLPYDYNRLRESGTTSVADYINASVIEGLHSHYPYYIVTQYPLVSTQNDFWRMVWKQRVSSVIGLVSSSEKEVYFPTKTGMTRTFGNIKVQTLSTLTVHRCTFRCLKILKGSKSHTVNHFQSAFLSNFTKDECSDLVNLVNLVHSNAEDGHDSRPMVIHCLNGTGKSGLFVAMDYLLQLINNGDTHVDIFKLTQILINNRAKLIENETQYQFLHDCVEFYLEHRKSSQFHGDSEFNFKEEEDAGLIEISPTDKTTFFTKKH